MKKLAFILFISFASVKTYAQTSISAKDAAKHIGESVTINDKIYGGKFLEGPAITLLDMGGAHPNEALTLLIKGDDRKKFTTAPEDMFKNKAVTVTGTVIDYKGKPEIVITEATQIKLVNKIQEYRIRNQEIENKKADQIVGFLVNNFSFPL